MIAKRKVTTKFMVVNNRPKLVYSYRIKMLMARKAIASDQIAEILSCKAGGTMNKKNFSISGSSSKGQLDHPILHL